VQTLSLIQSYLLAERLVTRPQLAAVQELAQQQGTTFTCALVQARAIDEEELAAFLARRLALPRAASRELFSQAPGVIDHLDAAFAARHRVLALRIDADELITAMSDPSDSELVEVMEQRTEMTVARVVVRESALDQALQHHYGAGQFDPQPASGELRALFSSELSPIPLVRAKGTLAVEDHVTAPFSKLALGPFDPASFEPPPLPDDLEDESPPPLPDDALDAAPTTLHSPRVMTTAGVEDTKTAASDPASRTQPLPPPTDDPPAPATKTRPLPAQAAEDPELGASAKPSPRATDEDAGLVDEYEVSVELSAQSVAPQHLPASTPEPVQTQPERPRSGAELLAYALAWLGAVGDRRLILRLDNAELQGWVGDGFGPAIDVRAIAVQAAPASVFGRTLGTGRLFVGPLGFSRAERRFAMMVGKHAREMLLAPVVGPQGAIALVYCDELRGALRREELERFTSQLAVDLGRCSS
jgi:hypothetical protein